MSVAYKVQDSLRVAPEPQASLPGTSIGSFMRLADAYRLSLELTNVAITVAIQAGAPDSTIRELQRQLDRLKKVI